MTASPGPVLYCHIADDGGVFTIDGATAHPAWITATTFARDLARLAQAGGSVLLSKGQGSDLAAPMMALVDAAGVAVTLAAEPHPDAVLRRLTTTLMASAYSGEVDVVADLLDRGAPVGAIDADGFDALMYAANGGQLEMARLLIAAGSDVGHTAREGASALLLATQHGHTAIAELLVAAGARLSAPPSPR